MGCAEFPSTQNGIIIAIQGPATTLLSKKDEEEDAKVMLSPYEDTQRSLTETERDKKIFLCRERAQEDKEADRRSWTDWQHR